MRSPEIEYMTDRTAAELFAVDDPVAEHLAAGIVQRGVGEDPA